MNLRFLEMLVVMVDCVGDKRGREGRKRGGHESDDDACDRHDDRVDNRQSQRPSTHPLPGQACEACMVTT